MTDVATIFRIQTPLYATAISKYVAHFGFDMWAKPQSVIVPRFCADMSFEIYVG